MFRVLYRALCLSRLELVDKYVRGLKFVALCWCLFVLVWFFRCLCVFFEFDAPYHTLVTVHTQIIAFSSS